jgi:selenocysteine lyase/cysteine desulfurase
VNRVAPDGAALFVCAYDRRVDVERFRSEFPVFARRAYLNTGTDGPLPTRAVTAAAAQFARELHNGRSGAEHSASHGRLAEQLRARLANLIGASTDEVALTHSTTEGINIILSGLQFREGDEVLTSDEEHTGLLAPLGALQRRGVVVRQVPLADIADSAGTKTKLIAVSHVSWMRGLVAPIEQLAAAGPPLLLDGAQSAGAIPVDVHTLGCDFYAAAGQKWLCGPDGTGLLYVRGNRIEELGIPWPSYVTLGDPARPFELVPARGARRFDGGEVAGPVMAASLASLDVLEEAGWDWIFATSRRQAQKLRDLIADRVELIRGDATTLVTWRPPAVTDDEGALAEVQRLEAEDVIVRAFAGRPWLRASVGAWSSDADLERLVALCS